LQLKSFDEIQRHHRHIFLSPHFDDAVYSCGGTLGVQVSAGIRPLVITVFGGAPTTPVEFSPFAIRTHRSMGFSQDAQAAVATRRREDAAALDYLRTDYLWLDYADAMYRGTPPYYPNEVVGVDVHPGDLWIDRELAQNLVTLSERLHGSALRRTIDRIVPPTALQGAVGPSVAKAKRRSASIVEAKPGVGAVSIACATGLSATQHAAPCASPLWAATCAALVRSVDARLPTCAQPPIINNGTTA
jgi:hypothetical protein